MARQLLTERTAAVVATVGFVVFVALGGAMAWLLEAQLRDGERNAQLEIAATHGQLVLDQLGRANASTAALAAALYDAPPTDSSRFRHTAAVVFDSIGGVSMLAWAPEGTVRAVHPAEDSAMVDRKLLTDPTFGALAKRALAAGRTIISGPIADAQGRSGLVAISPVRPPDAAADKMRGFAMARVELDAFLEATRLDRLPDHGQAYELAETFAEKGRTVVVARSHNDELRDPAEVRINSEVTHWVLRVAPRHEAYAFALHWAIGIVLLLGILVGRVLHAHLLQMVALRNEYLGRRRAEEGLRDVRRQLKVAKDELSRQAAQDGLTGLGGRAWFSKWLENRWLEAARAGRQMSLAVFDIDGFGAYNLERGHADGDACLRQVAATLAEQVGEEAAIARLESDCFVIVIVGADAGTARSMAEHAVKAVRALGITRVPGDARHPLTISAGVITIQPEATMAPGETLRAAHEALDRAREQGGDQFIAVVLAARSRRITGRSAQQSAGHGTSSQHTSRNRVGT